MQNLQETLKEVWEKNRVELNRQSNEDCKTCQKKTVVSAFNKQEERIMMMCLKCGEWRDYVGNCVDNLRVLEKQRKIVCSSR
jgi:RNase P subunit RPR2